MSPSSPASSHPYRKWFWFLLSALLLIAVTVAVFSAFVVQRATIEYRYAHDFPVSDPTFFASAHALGDPGPIDGNAIHLLQNGDEAFPAMLEAIRSAKASVNFEAFLFFSDSVGRQFIEAFCAKAKEGVRVRVMLDAMGSGSNFEDADEQRLKDAGCSFAYYHRAFSWRVDKLNRRSHRRVLVVDGKVAFTGGMGFADLWSGHAESPDHWRDVHVRVEGPVVAKFQGAFQQHWVRETGETISGLGEFPPLEKAGNLPMQLLASHSYSISPLSLVRAVALASAEKTIYITNAYTTPSEAQVKLLTAAVARGVDVRILLPGRHNDQPATKAAGRGAYGDLLKGGVKIFEFNTTMIHTKDFVVDGQFVVIGSSNFDARSSRINEELDLTIYDKKFGAEMDQVFLSDLANAKPYTLQEFESRSFWERTMEWITLPFRSQL